MHGDSGDAIKTVIREGVPGTSMPAFSEFTPQEAADLVAYIKGLSRGTNRQLPRRENPAAALHG